LFGWECFDIKSFKVHLMDANRKHLNNHFGEKWLYYVHLDIAT